MGDHTETIEIDFNPDIITFEEILHFFWKNHNSNRGSYRGRQYLSILLYHDEKQKESIFKVKKELEEMRQEEIQTEIAPYVEFTLAEERHQKYYLKRYPNAIEQLHSLYPSTQMIVDSRLAARLNGFVKGYGTLAGLKEEIMGWDINEDSMSKLLDVINSIRW